MPHRITHVSIETRFVVALHFSDGSCGSVDLEPWFAGRGGLFTALQNPEFFQRVKIDPDSHTLVWPNGVDLDPAMLYDAARTPAHRAH
jgi:Protein of unknown function (DUF2442)